jgi:hypothetical protein
MSIIHRPLRKTERTLGTPETNNKSREARQPEPHQIAFLGLDWDDRCVAFYRNERLVKTASFWQVRQPVYASSVGRWRRYAKHLGPLFAALGIAAAEG